MFCKNKIASFQYAGFLQNYLSWEEFFSDGSFSVSIAERQPVMSLEQGEALLVRGMCTEIAYRLNNPTNSDQTTEDFAHQCEEEKPSWKARFTSILALVKL